MNCLICGEQDKTMSGVHRECYTEHTSELQAEINSLKAELKELNEMLDLHECDRNCKECVFDEGCIKKKEVEGE